MKKSSNSSKSRFKFSAAQKIQLIIAIFACLVVQFLFILIVSRFTLQKRQSDARVFGEKLARNMNEVVERGVETADLMELLYKQYGKDFTENFQPICQSLLQNNIGIGSMYFAPDGIIQYGYPKLLTEKAIGLNLFADPALRDQVVRTLNSRSTTLAGPNVLVEGGIAFVIRNPIIINGEFVAYASVSIRTDVFLYQSLDGLRSEAENYIFCVQKDYDGTCVNEFGDILTNSIGEVGKELCVPVSMPGENWRIYVEPKDGWLSFKSLIPAFIVSIVTTLLFLFFILLHQFQASKKTYALEHDSLTGVLTRSAFHYKMAMLFKATPDVEYDLLLCDIQNFKVVNSLYSPQIGDAVLRHVANTLQACNVYGYTARYGADQFIMVFPTKKRHSYEVLVEQTEKMLESAPVPNLIVKYGLYDEIDKSLPLNMCCDRALVAARSIMHNYSKIIEHYEGSISHNTLRTQMLESSFEKALMNQEFQVWFQPKFDSVTEKLVGAEALVRWRTEDGTFVSPADFVPVFEEDGLIVRLDEFVFRTVCAEIRYLLSKLGFSVPVSVNISRISLSHANTIKRYSDIVYDTKIPINLVPLEITESASTANTEIKELAKQLKDAGFSIHMDDFGTGLSSLESLNLMPFDVIKLDKSLIDYIGDEGGNEILRHVVEMAHFKNMKVVAEGVESLYQLEFLRTLNCNIIQGYYFSAPLPFEKWEVLLSKMAEDNKIIK